ncbi:serine/threonine dehydratase [Oerskovia sp. Sa1BUA8]|uniref:Serine/threonine dehydratase n=1 Tax=Oerskovia douganii TaxID=2762210 RepID=A0A9D5YWR9_9CELL|nr:serine/threonine dehydratase [Oerskovia douganii]MBE7698798.1 serine/threonine dehydratase [Oerskovia douganii]
MSIDHLDVLAAAQRIAGQVRPVTLAPLDPGALGAATGVFALELMQHTGSFKARGALNFVGAHLEAGTLPESGVVIASGGNAGMANAWAARAHGVRATVFVPVTAPAVKVARLRTLGAEVHQVGAEYAEALDAAQRFASRTGALSSHAYDDPLIAAGAGTLLEEIVAARPDVGTVVVAVGGGGLFSGVAAAARPRGIRVVAVEPDGAQAMHAALDAGRVVDVPVASVAADSLGARRTSETALRLAQHADVRSVLVTDAAIVAARRHLWDERRLAVEHGAAAALAALESRAYVPEPGEKIAIVLCGANTDPADLAR